MKTLMSFFAVLLLFSEEGIAQSPFSSLDVSLSGQYLARGGEIAQYWNPSPGISLDIRTPYFKGELEAGVRYLRFSENVFEDSGFHSSYVFAGWSYPLALSDRIRLSPGFRIGVTYLTQDHDKVYEGYRFHRDESEFSWEVQFRKEYALSSGWGLHFTSSFNRTVLHHPMNAWYLAGGITARLTTPSWMKTLLR